MSDTVDVAVRMLILETARPGVAARVYPLQLPDNVEYPAVVYAAVSDVAETVNGNDSGFRRMRYQVDSFGRSLRDARRIDALVREALSGYRGSVHGVRMAVFRVNTYPVIYEEEGLYRVVSDFGLSVVCG